MVMKYLNYRHATFLLNENYSLTAFICYLNKFSPYVAMSGWATSKMFKFLYDCFFLTKHEDSFFKNHLILFSFFFL